MTQSDDSQNGNGGGALPLDPFATDDDPRIGLNRVWFNLLRVQRSMTPRIVRALRRAGLEDPVWYEILVEIERAGPDGLAMHELEQRLFTPQYALSRQVGRMAEKGWIARSPRPGRGRGLILTLTGAGQGLHQSVWPTYEAVIREEIGGRLTTDEAYALARLLIRLYP
ncbi:Multiple antibiotic resistance protein MarR [Roseivivax jejudonensis]|uniref:Multiple antibiotic resistance protein MarR n=1 Tax=Roseivivax jejudonensis TaxID=1529041 RepID=A0A1X6ZLE6_9RHOB|nr:MarR family transcriptional regulator [Roseivivax jejudonensis]SLN55288.1 Multiple antibiotic resistance protein MarR [Roseivivax jejudonensis]